MVAALNDTLLDDARMPAVRADVEALVDAEVSDKTGASGLALKGGYSAVKKLGPSIVPDAIEGLLPEFVVRLEPFWQEFGASGEASFSAFLTARGDAVSDALLGVTDDRIEASDRGAIKKVYGTLRPAAKKHVTEALPRLGDLVQKHAA
ncbi:DUF6918 family protein [Rhodococcus spongiicola]|uniref:Uncharacterized protein n=1 Tax=Rhodococcus spongiicola TaxID=2487352 RepID=A0A3S3DXZ6_9NOCA|nr:hypothetical protein [Rhodococcus spongiicola]RVW01544.1 hypothetical protein EF834_14035 [Rhodococcus spongiicola]